MKTLILSVSTALALGAVVSAAPVASVASSGASSAKQKIDRYLGQELVSRQLASLGVSRAQIDARLARLSDAQLQTVATQVDLLQAGGTIQGGNVNPWGPLKCILQPLGRLFYDVYQVVFCWGKLK